MLKHLIYRNTPVFYSDQGRGQTLVFLHGYLLSHEIWLEFTCPLVQRFRIICVDLPGHGRSGLLGPVSSMEDMAGAVAAVMDHLDIGEAVFFGHSMGGYATLALLEKRPDLFHALALFHSHPYPDSPEVKKKRDREIRLIETGHKHLLFSQSIPNMFAAERLHEHEQPLALCKDIAGRMSDAAVKAAILGLRSRPGREDVLQQAAVPCLMIAGKMDAFIPFDSVARKVALPARSMMLECERTGHMGFFEEPGFIREGILQFLNRIE